MRVAINGSIKMKFSETSISGAYTIDLEKKEDERGFFARFFCESEFSALGLESKFVQGNTSLSVEKSTLRGLHYQLAPMAETKLVRCIRGSIWDVIVDLRKESETFGRSFAAELSEYNRKMLYVPKGCAHGFLTLEARSELFYLVSETYSSFFERGIRWNDPFFAIPWPEKPVIISERDQCHPYYSESL